MNKKEITGLVLCGVNTLSVIGIIISLIVMNCSKMDATDVFNKDIKSIVEVRATTDSYGESFGTGIIYKVSNKYAYLITNSHVVSYSEGGVSKSFDSFAVRFNDKENYQSATFIRNDATLDLAILRIDDTTRSYKAITFSKGKCNYGDKVYAIGNTSNYGIGISEGIISVPEVYVTYDNVSRLVIQADIAISNGNSGGALLDKKGNLLGVTTFRTKDSESKINYGFAYSIPLSVVENFIK